MNSKVKVAQRATSKPPLPPGFVRRPMNRLLVTAFGRGASRWLAPRGMLMLTTVGRTTGKERTCPVLWCADAKHEAWVIAGGNYAKESMPNWYINLTAHPDKVWVDLGRGRVPVRAETLTGAERDPWIRAIPMISGLQHATSREVPIVRLTQRIGSTSSSADVRA
jgi:deazaflavin-dependent oxidoreductase (nitroreductase family)